VGREVYCMRPRTGAELEGTGQERGDGCLDLYIPYAHLKEAHDKGEMVQHQSENGKWHNCIHSSGWAYNDDPDRYRIKPKTKTLYKWAYRDKVTKSWKETDRWMESEDDFKNDYLWAKDEFKRLDYTAIEVEV
jgi:hypothetical protein